MPMYDVICEDGHLQMDVYSKYQEWGPCPECGKARRPNLATSMGAVISDEIPGGMWVHHGICNPDGSPRKYYSKSEMAQEAKKRGLVNHTDLPERKTYKTLYFTYK